jgi:hypothetical protein
MLFDNYPDDATYDPRAPWNQPETQCVFCGRPEGYCICRYCQECGSPMGDLTGYLCEDCDAED